MPFSSRFRPYLGRKVSGVPHETSALTNTPHSPFNLAPCPSCVSICPVCSTKCPNMDGCDLTPFPQPFCRRWVPCTNDCTCLRSDRPQNKSDPTVTPAGLPVCAEFEPCTKDCLCTIRSVTSYMNPDKLAPLSIICDVGVCNATCFCRTDLLKSLTAVLFPNTTAKFEFL